MVPDIFVDEPTRLAAASSETRSDVVEGLEGIDSGQLQQIGKATEQGCTISIAIRGAVAITVEVVKA